MTPTKIESDFGLRLSDIDGVQVPFLHMNQLIANKKAVNRPKDQLDVVELERIQKLLRDS